MDSKTTEEEAIRNSGALDERERARIAHRLEVLHPILLCKGKARIQAVSRQVEIYSISRSTIYGWLKNYERGEEKTSSLAGNKRVSRESRLSSPVLKIVNEVIATHFETSQKPMMERTIEKVRLQCREQGKKPPSARTIRTYIRLRDQRLRDQSDDKP